MSNDKKANSDLCYINQTDYFNLQGCPIVYRFTLFMYNINILFHTDNQNWHNFTYQQEAVVVLESLSSNKENGKNFLTFIIIFNNF